MTLSTYICVFLLTFLHGASLCCGQESTNAAPSSANSSASMIPSNGETVICMTQGGRTAVVRISTVKIDRSNIAFSSSYPLSEELSDVNEVTIVKNIELLVDGQKPFVYFSVLADLIEPDKASVALENGEFVLTIRGGDGSTSYFVRIYFNEKLVYRRSSYSPLCPNEPTAETTYWMRRPPPQMRGK
jgi:hypothetical protein